MASSLFERALDSFTTVIGPQRLDWLKDHAGSVMDRYPGWSRALAGGGILGITLFILGKLTRQKAIRVPHPNKRVGEDEPEVLIVGSGILGSILAAVLGRDGRRVTVIERDLSEPDRIVGEFMQAGGVAIVKKLGMEACFDGIDAQLARDGFIIENTDHTKRIVRLPVPPELVDGYGFKHGRFVQKLRKMAMDEDTVTYIEGVVLEILEEDGAVVGVRYRLKGAEESQELMAPLVVIADGIYSKFRKSFTKSPPVSESHQGGINLYDIGPSKGRGNVWFILGDQSWIVIYSTTSQCTRVLFDVPTKYIKMPDDMKKWIKDNVYPLVPENMLEQFTKEAEAGNYRMNEISSFPNNPILKPGVILLGDALRVRHPSTGTGLTSAALDVLLARDMLRKLPYLYSYSAVMTGYRQLIVDRQRKTFCINVNSYLGYHGFSGPNFFVRKLRRGNLEWMDVDGYPKEMTTRILTTLDVSPLSYMLYVYLGFLYSVWVNFKDQGVLKFPLAVFYAFMMNVKFYDLTVPYMWWETCPF